METRFTHVSDSAAARPRVWFETQTVGFTVVVVRVLATHSQKLQYEQVLMHCCRVANSCFSFALFSLNIHTRCPRHITIS